VEEVRRATFLQAAGESVHHHLRGRQKPTRNPRRTRRRCSAGDAWPKCAAPGVPT